MTTDPELEAREDELQTILDQMSGRTSSTPERPTFVTSPDWPAKLPADQERAQLLELLQLLATDDGDGTTVTTIAPDDLDAPLDVEAARQVLDQFQEAPSANDNLFLED